MVTMPINTALARVLAEACRVRKRREQQPQVLSMGTIRANHRAWPAANRGRSYGFALRASGFRVLKNPAARLADGLPRPSSFERMAELASSQFPLDPERSQFHGFDCTVMDFVCDSGRERGAEASNTRNRSPARRGESSRMLERVWFRT